MVLLALSGCHGEVSVLAALRKRSVPRIHQSTVKSDRPLVLQCWRTIIDREQLFPQALLWHHQWNAAEWRDIKNNEAGMSRTNISVRTHFLPFTLLLLHQYCYECPSLGKSLFDSWRFHTFPEFGSNTLLTFFFFFFCNGMQQMCNQQWKLNVMSAAVHYGFREAVIGHCFQIVN